MFLGCDKQVLVHIAWTVTVISAVPGPVCEGFIVSFLFLFTDVCKVEDGSPCHQQSYEDSKNRLKFKAVHCEQEISNNTVSL